ncbi:hypothetical protein GCM10008986_20410 [Salinibacillus aidingensis]|uniref:SR1 protein n=1 Tax=Salinibacillus aidingensis TaxID=237684 RepID=A0ABN1BAS9_9BACI
MQDPVGNCQNCGEMVYCKDGFLDGVHEGGNLFCNPCYSQQENSSDDSDR